jgi:hypothetical protein
MRYDLGQRALAYDTRVSRVSEFRRSHFPPRPLDYLHPFGTLTHLLDNALPVTPRCRTRKLCVLTCVCVSMEGCNHTNRWTRNPFTQVHIGLLCASTSLGNNYQPLRSIHSILANQFILHKNDRLQKLSKWAARHSLTDGTRGDGVFFRSHPLTARQIRHSRTSITFPRRTCDQSGLARACKKTGFCARCPCLHHPGCLDGCSTLFEGKPALAGSGQLPIPAQSLGSL